MFVSIADSLVEKGRKAGFSKGRKAGLSEGRKAGLSEGRKVGLSEGRKAGLSEGRKVGLSAILLKQLGLRFGRLAAPVRARVRAATVAQLDVWLTRVVAAESLDEVFAERPRGAA